MERRSSILQMSAHSCGVNDTEVLELFWVNTGTRRVDGMRLLSTCHSSMRRAASIRRLVFDFWIDEEGEVCPGVKTNSPCGQMARSYTASSPMRSPTCACTM